MHVLRLAVLALAVLAPIAGAALPPSPVIVATGRGEQTMTTPPTTCAGEADVTVEVVASLMTITVLGDACNPDAIFMTECFRDTDGSVECRTASAEALLSPSGAFHYHSYSPTSGFEHTLDAQLQRLA